MNVALAHHWFANYRGGERVLEQIALMFPGREIYTLLHNRELNIPGISGHPMKSSVLNRVPGILRCYRHLLPFHPSAIRKLRVSENTDVLLSSDAALIKGISVPEHTKHICYCHSPPRYLWEMAADYKGSSVAARFFLDRFAPMLRQFDYRAAQKVSHFIANSHFVADRIRKYYDREAEVIYPPVDVNAFRADQKREPFALVISELVPYKRIDVAVAAFNRLGRKLVVIGDGPERKKLESMAKPNIQFMGRQFFSTLKRMYETASVFIFPGIEDFGITPVEAQAAGCPVLAFRAGGALETVREGQTGAFFDEQNGECLADAVERFEAEQFAATACRRNAEEFSTSRFREQYLGKLSRALGRTMSPPSRTHFVNNRKLAVG